MRSLLRDVRYAFRTLRRRPGFTAVALLTLALGIGANSAIFSVIDGVLLRPLPYEEPDRVVRILGYAERRGLDRGTISYPTFVDLREAAESFEALAAYDEWQPVRITDGGAERLGGASVNPGFFRVLGVEPAAGRFFLPEEDEPGGEPVAVLSHGAWTRRFASDPGIVGSTVELGGTPYTVVGIAPADFEDPQLSGDRFGEPEVWRATPAYFDVAVSGRGGRSFTAVGRLREGVSLGEAEAEAKAIMSRLAGAYPGENAGRTLALRPIEEEIVGPARSALLVLFASVGLVLLIACANVANLLLGRAADREREIAVRASLGASRGRIVSQLLTESTVLALGGAGLGLLLAWLGTDAFLALAGGDLPRAGGVAVDGRVLAFTAGIALLTGLLFGTAPALHALGLELRPSLKEGGRGGGPGRGARRVRSGLVVAEVALAVVLLVGAGLLIRSLVELRSVEPGVRTEDVLTFRVDLPYDRYPDGPEVDAFYRSLLPRLEALPGVEGAAVANILPMSGSFNGMGFTVDGRPPPAPGEDPDAETRSVTPGYFATLGIPVVRGRGVAPTDDAEAPPVVVVNRALARRHWPDADPLGRRITVAGSSREIVGIVGDVRLFTLQRAPEPTLYLPNPQAPGWMRHDVAVALRTGVEPAGLVPRVRGVIREIDPGLPVEEVGTMEEMVAGSVAGVRFRTLLLGIFAAVALVLGVVGIYGVVSSAVARRVHELGIRMALGARPGEIVGMVLRQGMAPVAAGLVVGTGIALVAGRLVAGLLHGVPATDPVTFAAVPTVLLVAGLAACLLPARRATAVDPGEALREE